MNDPYQILNIPPTATDEEVKRAYRDLARKYHPDNYHDNPLADLAQEKMKEINEAYDQIQKQRKASSAASQSHSYGYGSGNSYGNSAYGGAYGAGSLNQVRMAINRGDISLAERLLSGVSDHNAEWNFLMGVVCSRRGWMDEAKRYMETAVQMDPNNPEYRSALSALTGTGYRPTASARSTRPILMTAHVCAAARHGRAARSLAAADAIYCPAFTTDFCLILYFSVLCFYYIMEEKNRGQKYDWLWKSQKNALQSRYHRRGALCQQPLS